MNMYYILAVILAFALGVLVAPLLRGVFAAWAGDIAADLKAKLVVAENERKQVEQDFTAYITKMEAEVAGLKTTVGTLTGLQPAPVVQATPAIAVPTMPS